MPQRKMCSHIVNQWLLRLRMHLNANKTKLKCSQVKFVRIVNNKC